MSSPGDPPIIITGGSVTIEFDLTQLTHVGNGKHHHPNKKIKRVIVKGDGIDFDKNITDGRVVITVHYGDDNKP
ncbi:MAG: hypothetical protein QOJ70_911 [Acidobacteriota bacterium]|jgi:hypothetical protein|nr:hypothetical protein [Acidobacteriota bacterium]MDT7807098.1 hypothetical protein [Acidobacteriota bacterium]